MQIDRKEYIFLLGGKDLEMMEIRSLLKQYGFTYIDKGLNWSDASWEKYKEYFDSNRVLVGVELSGKESKPENAIDIDHHNERSDEPASIEQVAGLIGAELNHWQQLVAANNRQDVWQSGKTVDIQR